MTAGWFITGTDTGVGKTFIAELVLEGLKQAGIAACGMKPVASGCRHTVDGLRSEDAERLIAASSVRPAYPTANPYAFLEPIAPHIAARLVGQVIDIGVIRHAFTELRRAARVVVEGVGGWRVPIGPRQTMADVAAALGLPVVLVVGVRLGCINHALLTADAIAADGSRLVGWVANSVASDLAHSSDAIAALEQRLSAPLLATIPLHPAPGARAQMAGVLASALLRP